MIYENQFTPFSLHKLRESTLKSKSGQQWWRLSDVINTLGLMKYAYNTDYSKKLSKDECRWVDMSKYSKDRGKGEGFYIVNEAGVYSLILQSNTKKCRDFKKYLAHVLIPRYNNFLAAKRNNEFWKKYRKQRQENSQRSTPF